MSGGPLSAFAVDPEPKNTYTNMTTLLGCDKLEQLEAIRCLQTLPIQTIINSDSKYQVSALFYVANIIIINIYLFMYLLNRILNYLKKDI